MISVTDFGSVKRFDLCRALPGGWHYWTTAYLVDGLLVDTGCAHAAPELIQALQGTGLEQITNTHSHEDHIGANGPLRHLQPGLEIRAHPLALPVLADPRGKQPLHPYRRVFWGWPQPSQGKVLRDGETIATGRYQFQVVYTPGHSPDHLCLYEPNEGWLFSGDLYVGGQDRALRRGSDVWQIIASLKKIADLPIQWLYPGSARVRETPQQELKSKITYLEELGEKVLEQHRKGESVKAIVHALCGAPMSIETITLGHFSRRRLVLSYLGENSETMRGGAAG